MRSIYKAAWGLVFLVAAVAAQETALRLAMPSVNPANHIRFIPGNRDLPILGPTDRTFRQIKNTGDFDVTVRFNRFGLREQKDITRSTDLDYFLVGDSFAFGWGVEESERVSNRISEKTGVPVYNVSITGNFDTYEKLLDYAASKGATVARVIILVTMENDLLGYATKEQGDPAPKAVAAAPGGLNFISFKELLMTNSALYFLMTSAVHNVEWIRSLAEKTGLIAANLKDEGRRIPDATDIRTSADRLAALSGRFEATVAIIPSRSLWQGRQAEALDKVHRNFVERLRSLGVDVVDLRPAFEKTGTPLALHFRNDPHWTTRGHRLAAEVIARHLASNRAGDSNQ